MAVLSFPMFLLMSARLRIRCIVHAAHQAGWACAPFRRRAVLLGRCNARLLCIGIVFLVLGIGLSIDEASAQEVVNASSNTQTATLEYAVKANYLYKFAPFVEWPVEVFATSTSPFNICIAGNDPFGALLNDAVSGQRINDHPIAIRRIGVALDDFDCHVLYAGSSPQTSKMLERFKNKPVLTVTDASQGVGGGIIQFVMTQGRIRFNIDLAAAAQSGLIMSSKLISLAVSIRRPTD